MLAKLSSGVKPVADWWWQRTLAQRFATLTAALIVGSLAIFGVTLLGVSSHIVIGLEEERVAHQLNAAADQLATRVRQLRRTPLILSGMPQIEHIVDLSTGETPREGESLEVWRKRLGIVFRSFVDANPSLMQVRFIGMADDGREIVRVNRAGDDGWIVDEADLQHKGDSLGFQEAAKLRAGEVHLSPIGSNVENGEAAKPLQPWIWAATPIFTEQGALFGVITVAAAADVWLRDISALSGISGTFLVANQNGDYLFRSDDGLIDGSLDRSGSCLRRDRPQLDAIFNRNAPNTLALRVGSDFSSARRVAYNPTDPSEFAVLLTDTPATRLFGQARTLILLGAALVLALSLLGVISAYFVSRPLNRLMAAARQIADGTFDKAAIAKDLDIEVGELGAALRIMREAVETRDASLRISEAHLRAIVDNTIDGLITIDRHGILLGYNHGCEDIFGYTSSEAVGQNIGLLLSKFDADQINGFLDDYAGSGQSQFARVRREITGRHKCGQPIDIEVAIVEVKIEGGVLFSSIVRDITEQKKVERMKSEFVSTVSHELRTPLTSIMGSLGLIRAGALGALSEQSEKMINVAYDNGARLALLINDILDFEKIEAGRLKFNKQSENLKALVEQAAQQDAAYALRHGVTLIFDDVPSDIVVETDPHRFGQVMDNLISNATKFSQKGGQVRIAAKLTGNTVRISVADQGPGIPAAFRESIFKKFAQADSSDARQKGGTGLGLSIAKAIVEQLGGEIGYETKTGAGTTFYFDLPARRSATNEESAPRIKPALDEDRILHDVPRDAA